MPIAIQESLLSGSTISEKFQHARYLGADGVEMSGIDLTDRVPEILLGMEQTGLRVAAINFGRQGGFVDPDPQVREQALKALRQSITNAVDLDADGVIFVPHFGDPVLPDLSPWMSAPELEVEMLYMHLRSLSDFSYAIGTSLFMEPVNRSATHLINRVEQMARITRRLDHPRVKVAASLFDMQLEEDDIPATLREYADAIAYLHVNPGADRNDFSPETAAALKDSGYAGWLTYQRISNAPIDDASLAFGIAALRKAGFS